MATPFAFTSLGPVNAGGGYDSMLKALLYEGEQRGAGVRALGDAAQRFGERRDRERQFQRQADLQRELVEMQGANEMNRDIRRGQMQLESDTREQEFRRGEAADRRSFEFSQSTADRELRRELEGMDGAREMMKRQMEAAQKAEAARTQFGVDTALGEFLNAKDSPYFRDVSVSPAQTLVPGSVADENAIVEMLMQNLTPGRPYLAGPEQKEQLLAIAQSLTKPVKAKLFNAAARQQLGEEVEARIGQGGPLTPAQEEALYERLIETTGKYAQDEHALSQQLFEKALEQARTQLGILAPTTQTQQALEQPGIEAAQQAPMPSSFNMRLDDIADPEELERMTGSKQLSGLLRALLVGSTGKAIPVGVNEDADGGVSFDLPDETAPTATQSILRQLEQVLNTPGIARDEAIGRARMRGQSPTRAEAMKVGGKRQPAPGKKESPAAESMTPMSDVDRLRGSFPELYDYLQRP